MDDTVMAATKNWEQDRDGEMDSAAPVSVLYTDGIEVGVGVGSSSSDNGNDGDSDVFRDLEHFLAPDTNRLTLKWEASADYSNNSTSKITVGVNTYLPLERRGCFSLEIPERMPSQSPSSAILNERQYHDVSARGLLFRLVSKIFFLSPWIQQLDLEGFGNRFNSKHHHPHQSSTTTRLDIEDVFEAFAREESSPWRRGILVVVRTWNCDMDSHKGNHCFGLAEHEYPEGLEEVYIHNPKGSVISSSIFKIASRAKKLRRFYVFDSCDRAGNNNNNNNVDGDGDGDGDANGDANNSRAPGRRANNNSDTHRFNGSRLTQSSIDAICEVLASTNQLLEMNQLPFRELLQLPETGFCKILKATTTIPNAFLRRVSSSHDLETICLRFPTVISPRILAPGLTILAARSETLRFYLLWKRSLEVLRNPLKKGISPLVLEKCQKRKSTKQWTLYNRIDLLFIMLQDSLEGILDASSKQVRGQLR